ncbi:hypothetical protein CRN61_29120 [Vibrio vulnificus]|uniref:carboxylate--amine ligase n=1 Tax=Vibrio vulnificus TaxID=672 RepID=UPI000C9E7E1B|nr:hypothetical protein [Vibrio vulnificus]PNG63359.1 hypothetical protein SC81_16560 [Vibrio vulnificus]POC05599.1 hypothetical protein CRN54_22535 [Vibrio vulnificus]POC75920.1 hypothetical protein CRN61_29120 [Vibrio vulnificus]
MKKDGCALVLGGHINGYSIVKELSQEKEIDILLMDYGHSIAKYSNKCTYHGSIPGNDEDFIKKVRLLFECHGKVVIYPTDDEQLELLHRTYDALVQYAYVPVNPTNLLNNLDKSHQYSVCEDIGIPYPRSMTIETLSDLDEEVNLMFPLLIKPNTRKDLSFPVFRNKYFESHEHWLSAKQEIADFISQGVTFLLSEFIPGDDTNIYAYTCVQDKDSKVRNEWIGKKLTQYPNEYGVFCSASNDSPQVVLTQGRKLVEAMRNIGVCEPEFKYDHRDGLYKLMETNLRSMMWHRVGCITGVNLHLTQYYLATNPDKVKHEQQELDEPQHLVLMLHEIPNLIARKGYFKHFKANIFGKGKRTWAVLDKTDLKPFFASIPLLFKMMVSACLRRLNLR